MAMTLGALMMGKHKKADLKAIQDEARKQQKKARKRGLWSSIGGTLGSLATPALMGALGVTTGPLGMMAAKMVASRIGRELGEESQEKVDYGAIKKAGQYGFHKDIAKDYTAGLEEARDALTQQQWTQSVVNPVQEYGIGKAGKELGKWAGGTEVGQKYGKWMDEGGLGLGKGLDKTGDFLSEYLPGYSQMSSLFKQVPEKERWDYEPTDEEFAAGSESYE